MRTPPALRQLLEPSLGKVGLSGIALCLALLAYAPTTPANLADGQASMNSTPPASSSTPAASR